MKKPFFNVIAIWTALMGLTFISVKAQHNNLTRKLLYAEAAIKQLYVDSVNEDKLVENAIKGMLEKMDPHSTYTTTQETRSFMNQLQGSFEGVGIQFNITNDTLFVIQAVSNGPSERAGILPGDRLVTVNDTVIAGVKMPQDEVMRRLRGKKGTKVKVGVMRRGIDKTVYFTITRDRIPMTTVDVAYMIRPSVGYVKIESFGENTYKELMVALEKLKAQGMKTLLLDLQDNGGGFLGTAVAVVNEFLNKGDLIVYTQGRQVPRENYVAKGDGKYKDLNLYVLVNEFSASASEITSGAMQDNDRAVIVGRRTFGKGLVQRPIEFQDGSMMRLTIAHYFTPAGRNIQKPYEKGNKEGYEKDFERRFKQGELFHADSIHFDKTQKHLTLKKKRPVYGGGGIMPDVFVPLDSTLTTPYFRHLQARGFIVGKTITFTDEHRKELLNKYPSFDKFNAKFVVPDELITSIVEEAKKEKVSYKDEEEWKKTLPMLQMQLKAFIARNLWDMTSYFKIINEKNPIITKALQLACKQK